MGAQLAYGRMKYLGEIERSADRLRHSICHRGALGLLRKGLFRQTPLSYVNANATNKLLA
jgi:hypothetical protein